MGRTSCGQKILGKVMQRTCFALKWPKLVRCKDRWNVYTMYSLSVQIFFNLNNVHWFYLTKLSYRYTKKGSPNYKNTRTNCVFPIHFLITLIPNCIYDRKKLCLVLSKASNEIQRGETRRENAEM